MAFLKLLDFYWNFDALYVFVGVYSQLNQYLKILNVRGKVIPWPLILNTLLLKKNKFHKELPWIRDTKVLPNRVRYTCIPCNIISRELVGWLVLGLTALWDNISVYIGPSPREREKEKRKDRREKKCPNNPTPHLLQAQLDLAQL